MEHLVDFTDYFKDVRKKVEVDHFQNTDLAIADVYEPSSLSLAGKIVSSDMGRYLEEWSARPSGQQVAILGEYGQGKSTGMQAFVHSAVLSDLRTAGNRVPILFELRGKSPSNFSTLELLAAWSQQYRIHAHALMKLLIGGRLILIFEGFDEMANVSDLEQRLAHFYSLWQFSYPNSKIIFMGRPNLFFEDRELEIVFQGTEGGSISAACEILRLVPFDIPKIARSLRWASTSTRDEIAGAAALNDQLLEIVGRPSLLFAVASLWPELRQRLTTGQMTSAQVIDRFILFSDQRQAEKERAEKGPRFMMLTTTERRYFHEGLAVFMASKGTTNQISRFDMRAAVERLYRAYPDEAHILPQIMMERDNHAPLRSRFDDLESAVEAISTDVRTHGIIVDDLSRRGAFRFAHKSFYEVLFAKSYAFNLLSVRPGGLRVIRIGYGRGLSDANRL